MPMVSCIVVIHFLVLSSGPQARVSVQDSRRRQGQSHYNKASNATQRLSTTERYHYDNHDQLEAHLDLFLHAYNTPGA